MRDNPLLAGNKKAFLQQLITVFLAFNPQHEHVAFYITSNKNFSW